MTFPGGRELLVALKASAGAGGPVLSLPVGRPVEAFLRPVATREGDLNAEDVRLLTEWRNRNVRWFLTEFRATEERTKRWLTETVGPDDTRILFMLDDPEGRTLGYIGLAFIVWEHASVELDAVVNGGEVNPWMMSRAARTLIDWAREQLGLPYVRGRIRSDNRALKFALRSLGAREMKRVPLRRVEEAGRTRWVEDPSLPHSEPSLVYITIADGTEYRD